MVVIEILLTKKYVYVTLDRRTGHLYAVVGMPSAYHVGASGLVPRSTNKDP